MHHLDILCTYLCTHIETMDMDKCSCDGKASNCLVSWNTELLFTARQICPLVTNRFLCIGGISSDCDPQEFCTCLYVFDVHSVCLFINS